MSDKTQRGLFTLLESSYQQQQVTLLVHQSFPEALSSQVALIVTLKLQIKQTLSTFHPYTTNSVQRSQKGQLGPLESISVLEKLLQKWLLHP